ncbi:hypothetical protein GGTG_06027 [Gaeumannomyces tritici R3-111a-1]|uniref:PD-(D/E)XK nuclease-like domain-containing protein n=1 Tax=Gaeumannomyces tritici (strain R3-111a-1) TaxID=644352 RepID=J3NXM1_GAET3|nr:hypothetical protein GGTG_06027 [Gaeumannomyces tritici R3-111a-1]EJT76103.1 hypothetical protein GGTG_06027 [Gaeumannomyces tritici R3-111a-1]
MTATSSCTIRNWLHQIDGNDYALLDRDSVDERPAKRICIDPLQAHEVTAQSWLPSSPPMPTSTTVPLRVTLKRTTDEMSDAPAAVSAIAPPLALPPRLPSPTKRRTRSTSPLKRTNLRLLQKPVHIKTFAAGDTLPDDIEPLLSHVQQAVNREEVIPSEVREAAVAAEGAGSLRPWHFRSTATPGADALHEALVAIRQDAVAATEGEYHEAGWNNLVHTPLLRHVFPSRVEVGRTGARLVPVMSAVIHNNYVPGKFASTSALLMNRLHGHLGGDSASVAGDSVSGSGEGSNAGSNTAGPSVDGRRSDSKKVDYVACLDVAADTPLSKVLYNVTYNQGVEADILPHVNHVLYAPLQWSPIAVSIETKTEESSRDAMLQLSIWVAAWHNRMDAHRQLIRRELPELWTARTGAEEARIPSTVLFKVVNNSWLLYFACDRGTHIDLLGPFDVGGTQNLKDIYALVAVLLAVRNWMEEGFRDSVAKWFMCEAINRALFGVTDKEESGAQPLEAWTPY